ncbi:MAG: hypothetical protein ACRCXZ_03745 [Patescibacteria group bacterium]
MTLLELIIIALLPTLGISGFICFTQFPVIWAWLETFGMPNILEVGAMIVIVINGVPLVTTLVGAAILTIVTVVTLLVSGVINLIPKKA